MSAEIARHLREEQTQEPLEKTRSAKNQIYEIFQVLKL